MLSLLKALHSLASNHSEIDDHKPILDKNVRALKKMHPFAILLISK